MCELTNNNLSATTCFLCLHRTDLYRRIHTASSTRNCRAYRARQSTVKHRLLIITIFIQLLRPDAAVVASLIMTVRITSCPSHHPVHRHIPCWFSLFFLVTPLFSWLRLLTPPLNSTFGLSLRNSKGHFSSILERFRGTIFRAKICKGATDFFEACSIRFFGTENPCGLAFIWIMVRMEILRHRVQIDFSHPNLVRETSIFRGRF